MRNALVVILGLVLLAGLAGVYLAHTSGGAAQSQPARKSEAGPVVVASSSIIAGLVEKVAPSGVKISPLAKAGVDPHHYEPTPSDARAIANADVLVMAGAGFDDWLPRIAQSTRSKATIIRLGDFASLLGNCPGHADDDHHGHDHGDLDPHFWQDPTRVAKTVLALAEELAKLSPEHAATYRANAVKFSQELVDLDIWISQQTGAIPESRRKLFTRHDAMGYYAKRYGFELLPTLQGVSSSETSEPSAKRVAQIIAEIKASGVPVIFSDTQTPDRLIARIARDANVKIVPGLYTDALGAPGSDGETYTQMMRTNTRRIVDGLK